MVFFLFFFFFFFCGVGVWVCMRSVDVYGWECGVGGVCACGCLRMCLYILTLLCLFPLQGPSRGSVYIEIGGLPKQRVSYSKVRDM